MGMIGTVVAAGLTAGPALGGFILAYFSWRLIFFINIPIGILSGMITLRVLGEKGSDGAARGKPIRGAAFDWPGAILLAICFCFFILGVNRGGTWGYASWRFCACIFTHNRVYT